jgi:hypothetical protein
MEQIHEQVMKLAQAMAGEAAEDTLEALCHGAEALWEQRLKQGVTAADCGWAFVCAAALSAAAALSGGRGAAGVSSFTAGDVTVRSAGGADTAAAAAAMADQAERLMAPYVDRDDFAFCGVKG